MTDSRRFSLSISRKGVFKRMGVDREKAQTLLLPLELEASQDLTGETPVLLIDNLKLGDNNLPDSQGEKPPIPEISAIAPRFAKIPDGNFFLFYGQAGLLPFFIHALSQWLLGGENIVWVDGANCFEPYVLARLIQKKGKKPEELMRHIFISRAFTAHQLEALVVERLEEALKSYNSRIAVIYGCLNLLYDEDISPKEVNHIFPRIIRQIDFLKRKGIFILGVCPPITSPPSRKFLLASLKHKADRVFYLRETEKGVSILEENIFLKIKVDPVGVQFIEPEK